MKLINLFKNNLNSAEYQLFTKHNVYIKEYVRLLNTCLPDTHTSTLSIRNRVTRMLGLPKKDSCVFFSDFYLPEINNVFFILQNSKDKQRFKYDIFFKVKKLSAYIGEITICKNKGVFKVETECLTYIHDAILENTKNKKINIKQHVLCEYVLNADRNRITETSSEIYTTAENKNNLNSKYPFIQNGIFEVFSDYLFSESNVLLLIGPPGTGKSNAIKQLLCLTNDSDYSAYVCSDYVTMKSTLLVSKIYSNTLGIKKIVVLEDADEFVKRRDGGNDIMSLLLNKTDGLISNEVKIVISTNLSSIKSIDPALLRPGRCFKVLQFETLTLEQAQAIRDMNNIPTPINISNKKLTLSEVYNGEQTYNQSIGFNN